MAFCRLYESGKSLRLCIFALLRECQGFSEFKYPASKAVQRCMTISWVDCSVAVFWIRANIKVAIFLRPAIRLPASASADCFNCMSRAEVKNSSTLYFSPRFYL